MPELAAAVLEASSRRGFLSKVGRLLLTVSGGSVLAAAFKAEAAGAYHFCGHTFTTASCPHPTGLPRIDRNGFPLRARDGRPVDDLGRLVNAKGRPVDEHGRLLRDPDGHPLPPAPRRRLCKKVGQTHGFTPHIDGAWYR